MASEVSLNPEGGHKKRRPRSKQRLKSDDELSEDGGSGVPGSSPAINDMLSSALERSKEDKKKKKKKKKSGQDIVSNGSHHEELESLRKGDGVRKEEDRLLLANTYDPDDAKPHKSNKRRQKERDMQLNGQDNEAYLNEDDTTEKKKHKKKSSKHDAETIADKTMTISELATSPASGEEHEDLSPKDNRKKKKKRRTPREIPSPAQQEEQAEEQHPAVMSGGEASADTAEDRLFSQDDDEHTHQKKKKKKKKKHRSTLQDEEMLAAAYDEALGQDGEPVETQVVEDEAQEEEQAQEELVIEDEGKIIGLTIHRTDKLKMSSFLIAHPLVKVYVVDMETGRYLKKTDRLRPVTAFFERERDNVDFIMPIMTQAFDFKQNKSTIPVWEEQIILNENFNYIIQRERPKVMLMFELLDYVSMTRANQQYNNAKQDGGWYQIAWGFLKCMGANGQPNTDKKVRLQLYHKPVRFRARGEQLEVFQWYAAGHRDPYPSTLYVTVKGIVPPDAVAPAARSANALQEERGQLTFDDLAMNVTSQQSLGGAGATGAGGRRQEPSPWTRLPGQLCKVPNSVALTLPGGRKGCSVVRFSPDGKSLACGCHDKDSYPIRVYEIPSGKARCEFVGHYSIIYDLDWSKDSKQLLSCSADGTGRVWDVENMAASPLKTLPHPSFVYTCRFHPRVNKVVVSGGYDKILRVWTLQTADKNAQLLQELEGHGGIINSLCWDEEGSRLYTGDSVGVVCQWNAFATDAPSKRGVLKDWTLNREIVDGEIKGLCINSLTLHVSGRRLLVHCRDNTIRMLDLRISEQYGHNAWESGAVMQRYIGALNFRERIRSVLTPCSAFIVAGSEDSCAYMWNTETGDQVAMYTELGYRSAVCDVHFHPHDHVVAFCAFGENHPVVLYKYDHKVAAREAGLDNTDGPGLHRPMSPTGPQRPMSPTINPSNRALGATRSEDVLEKHRSKVQTISDDFAASESARLDRVMKKLLSVNTLAARGGAGEHPLAVPPPSVTPRPSPQAPPPGTSALMSTWGSTFDASVLYSQTPRAMDEAIDQSFAKNALIANKTLLQQMTKNLAKIRSVKVADENQEILEEAAKRSPPPSTFSPHSTNNPGNLTLLTQQQQQAGQRAGFSPIGRSGGSLGRAASFSLTKGVGGGKAQFTYQGPQARAGQAEQADEGEILAQVHSPQYSAPRHSSTRGAQVVALYDYTGQRSDELSLAKGDRISVLYKDNDNWWMGEHQSGQQGFFPANYVAGYDNEKSVEEVVAEADDLRLPSAEPDEVRTSTTTAVVDKGQLKFISGGEDSETESVRPRTKKKRHSKHQTTTMTLEDESMPPRPQRKKKHRSRESEA